MILVLIGRFFQFILTFALLRTSTTLLSVNEIGRLSLILSTVSFFALFFINPVGLYINRSLNSWYSQGKIGFHLRHLFVYLLVVTMIAGVSIEVLNTVGFLRYDISPNLLILLVCGGIFFNTINQTVIPALNLLGYTSRYLILTVLTVLIGLLFAVALTVVTEGGAKSWYLGLIIGQAVMGLVGAKILFELIKEYAVCRKGDRNEIYLGDIFKFSIPLAIVAGLGWIQTQGYRYIAEEALGLPQLGVFYAGYGVAASLVAAFELVVVTYFQPKFYKSIENTSDTEIQLAWRKYATEILPLLFVTFVFISACAPEMTRFFLGPGFYLSESYIIWGAIAESFRVMVGVYSLALHAKKNTYSLMFPSFLAASIAIGANLVLIEKFGMIGVGISLACAGFVLFVVMHIRLKAESNYARLSWFDILFRPAVYSFILFAGILIFRFSLNGEGGGVHIIILVLSGGLYSVIQYVLFKKKIAYRNES